MGRPRPTRAGEPEAANRGRPRTEDSAMWWHRPALIAAYAGAFAVGAALAATLAPGGAPAPQPVPLPRAQTAQHRVDPVPPAQRSADPVPPAGSDAGAQARLLVALTAAREYASGHDRSYFGLTRVPGGVTHSVSGAAPGRVVLLAASGTGRCFAIADTIGGERTYASTTGACSGATIARLRFTEDAGTGWQTAAP